MSRKKSKKKNLANKGLSYNAAFNSSIRQMGEYEHINSKTIVQLFYAIIVLQYLYYFDSLFKVNGEGERNCWYDKKIVLKS